MDTRLQKKFQDVKNSMTAETELTIPKTKHSFFIAVDSSFLSWPRRSPIPNE